MYRPRGARWTLSPVREKMGDAAQAIEDPPTPRRPGDQAGEGTVAWAPLTALGEGSSGRSMFESSPTHPRRAWQATVRGAARRPPAGRPPPGAPPALAPRLHRPPP